MYLFTDWMELSLLVKLVDLGEGGFRCNWTLFRMYCISKVHTNMLPKILFIAKVLIQISLVTTGNVKDNVSKTWHRTQVFIYYNKANFDEDHLDCLGTILSHRFILTAATCVMNSDVPLSNAIVFQRYIQICCQKFYS